MAQSAPDFSLAFWKACPQEGGVPILRAGSVYQAGGQVWGIAPAPKCTTQPLTLGSPHQWPRMLAPLEGVRRVGPEHSPRVMPLGRYCWIQERQCLWAGWEDDSAQGPWQLSLWLSPWSHTALSLLTQPSQIGASLPLLEPAVSGWLHSLGS